MNTTTTKNNISIKTIKFTIIVFLINSALIVTLLAFRLIGEVVFCTLFIVISLASLFMAFSDRVELINLKDLTLKLAKVKEIQQAVIVKQTEPPVQSQGMALKVEMIGTDPKTDLVIKAMGNSSYIFRNIEGIMVDTKLHSNEVENSLNWLISNKFVVETTGIGGNVYSLTPNGHSVFVSLLDSPLHLSTV